MVDPRQKKLLAEIMEADAKDGLYDNHKLTAVEYLVSIVQKCIAPDYIPIEIVQQAKAMEKEQILNASRAFADYPFDENDIEQYYNETYNK